MKKKYLFGLLVVLLLGILGFTAVILHKNNNGEDNFFKYAVDLENEDWAYAPKGFSYDMAMEDIVDALDRDGKTWKEVGGQIVVSETLSDVAGQIDEMSFVTTYFVYEEYGLTGVMYRMVMDASYEETIRQLLYEQALEYMPEVNWQSDIEDIKDVGNTTVVVWDDSVFQPEAEQYLINAKSDALLRIEEMEDDQLLVYLSIGRYE